MAAVLVVGIAATVVTQNAFAVRNIGGSVSGAQDNGGQGGNFNTGETQTNTGHTGGTNNGGGCSQVLIDT